MGNEQQVGTSHHFIMDTPNNKGKERINPQWIKQVSKARSRPSWQIARDISMDMLSKESPKLSSNQGICDDFINIHVK